MAHFWCIQFIVFLFLFAYCCPMKFKAGNVYQYSYSTSTLFSEVNTHSKTPVSGKDVGVQLSVEFDLTPLVVSSEGLVLKLQLTSAKFSSVARPEEERLLPSLLRFPALFELAGDSVQQLFLVDQDPVYSTNIKKGIVALFQLQQQPGERAEIDVSGECQVSYTVTAPNSVSKSKVNCQNMEIAGQFTTPNKMLSLSVFNKATMHYELKDGIVNRASGTSRLMSYLNLRTSLNGGAISSQKVALENTIQKNVPTVATAEAAVALIEKETGRNLLMSLLPSEVELQQCTENCKSPKELVAELHDDLVKEKLATVDSAKAFVKVLRSLRNANKHTIAQVFTAPDSYYLVTQLIDAATAAQTRAAQEALLDLLAFDDENALDYPQRYLFAAAYSTHPSQALIEDLLGVLKKNIPSDSLKESLLLGLGAIVHTFCQVKDQCQHKLVKEVRQLLVSGLDACGEPSCRCTYLRALGNAGLSDTVGVILNQAESPANPMLAFTAITALRRIHPQFLDLKVQKVMQRIFHQTFAQHDSSVRAAALDILLKTQPSPQVLKTVLLGLTDQTSHEFSTYVYNFVMDTAAHNPGVRESLIVCLQDSSINNYYIRSQKGKSSIFTSFLAKTSDINATYSMYIENSNSGIMKRSGMDVNLLSKFLNQPFMKFGIYAEGLESLVGEGEETEGSGDASEASAEVEPTAGMTFTLMDVLLTQMEFFRGSAGLMSAVWNAPSELTSALQGNLLLQDHSQRVHLSNGLVVSVDVLGVLSMDLSGFVSISLWNRNCQALIKNSGALYIEGTVSLDSSLFNSGLMFSGEGESAIDFTTDAEFYDMPLKLCMQMMRPQFNFKQSVTRFESLKGIKKLRRRNSRTSLINPESYFLNKANSAECNAMNTGED